MAGSSYFTGTAPSLSGYSFGSQVPSYFSNPSFGIDSFGGLNKTASALTSSPLGSSTPKLTGMDPFSAVLGVGSIAASIFGGNAQQKAAQEQAAATEEAARIAAASTEKAAKTAAAAQLAGKLGGYGLDFQTALWETGAGAARQRRADFERASQEAAFQARNPDLATLRSLERYESRLRGAMPGFMPPTNLFA